MSSDTESGEKVLEEAFLHLPYIPDFLTDDVRYWFVPSREAPRAVYQQLIGDSAKNWSSYYTKKGWNFVHDPSGEERDGPYRVEPGETHIDILEPGKIFAPKPQFAFGPGGETIPMPGLEKHRPLNPWKPNYIKSIVFIKRYEWPRPVPRRVQAAIFEIEECGQIAGSTSWINAEAVLLDSDSDDVRHTLVDVFFNRPEDYELGSQIYLRVLGKLGDEGFAQLVALAKHPITRKRIHVARTLGKLGDPRGLETLLLLLDDEDFDVLNEALCALCNVGVDERTDSEGKVRSHLESEEVNRRVWAAGALARGGDAEQRKFLLQLVKEDPRPLADLGELGDVMVALDMVDAVPFLIQRFKSDRHEVILDAAETLERLTGLEADVAAQEGGEAKRLAIKAYNRWWDDRKRERSTSRKKGKR